MKSNKKPDSVRFLRRKMIVQTIVIVIGSVCMFELVDYATHIMLPLTRNTAYDPIDGIGMILPMALIVGFMFRHSLKGFNRYFRLLTNAINRVASGDFSLSLKPKDGGPFRPVFENFNKMTLELQSVQTLKDDFTNQFSHEFKTPISSISGFAKMLQEENLSPEKQQEYLGIISEESRRLADLSGKVMMLSQLESQQWLIDKTNYFLDEQIKECVILLAPEWSKKNIEIDADMKPVGFRGNSELMKQLWINLINNAIKYSPGGTTINLSLEKQEKEAVVRIKDQGKGISLEDQNRIFQKYFRIEDPNTADSEKGLGLGLSIVKRILFLCGGQIEVESTLGEGSLFTVRLPLESVS